MDVEIQAVLNQYFHSINNINNHMEPLAKDFSIDPLINQKAF